MSCLNYTLVDVEQQHYVSVHCEKEYDFANEQDELTDLL